MNTFIKILAAFCLFTASTALAQEQEPANTEETPQPQIEKSASQLTSPQATPAAPHVRTPLDELKDLEGKEPPDRFLSDMLNMLTTLGLMVAVLVGISWFLKKMLNTRIQQANSSSLIKIQERRALSPKTAIYLLDICGKGIVIAESQNGTVHLADVNITEEDFPEQESHFKKILDQKNQQKP